MNLFSETIDREIEELMANRVKLNFLGRLSRFSSNIQKKMKKAMEKTKENNRSILNVMVNYGGRAELVDAVQAIIKEGRETVDEGTISQHLYTKGIPGQK